MSAAEEEAGGATARVVAAAAAAAGRVEAEQPGAAAPSGSMHEAPGAPVAPALGGRREEDGAGAEDEAEAEGDDNDGQHKGGDEEHEQAGGNANRVTAPAAVAFHSPRDHCDVPLGKDDDGAPEGALAFLAADAAAAATAGQNDPDAVAAFAERLAALPEVSPDDLAQSDGVASARIHIAVAGMVFDMTAAPDFYGPGAGYALFAGHDATVNLARSSLTPATVGTDAAQEGLTADDLECLHSWVARYKKKYPLVGRFAGNAGALALAPSPRRPVPGDGETGDEGDCVIS